MPFHISFVISQFSSPRPLSTYRASGEILIFWLKLLYVSFVLIWVFAVSNKILVKFSHNERLYKIQGSMEIKPWPVTNQGRPAWEASDRSLGERLDDCLPVCFFCI